jgi:prolyl oligopeptidase
MTVVVRVILASAVVLAGCNLKEPEISMPRPPQTKTQDIVDTLHGVEIHDPYRWLEDQDSPETRAWIDKQNAYTDEVLNKLSGRDRLINVVTRMLERDVIGLPYERSGQYFYSKRLAEQELSVLYVRDGVDGEDEVLIDPHPLSSDHTTSVSLADISKDGSLVAYRVREGGVDEVSIRVMNVKDRAELPDFLPAARYGTVSFTPDLKGFFYERYGDVTPRVMYHIFGTDPSEDRMLFGEGYERHHIPVTLLSDNGRWLVVHIIEGSSGPTEIHIKDLQNDGPFDTVIADGISESWAEFAGDQLVITTNLDAPNKRVVLADPANPSVSNWREIIPERPEVVLQDAHGRGGKIIVSYLENVQPMAAVYDLNGQRLRDISFDTLGSVGGGSGRWESNETFFTFQTFHSPSVVYRYDLETGNRQVWEHVDFPIELDKYEAKQVWYYSKDGTQVPMFVVSKRGLVQDGSNPVLLTGYGGFNLSRTPSFSTLATTWLESGGVYAIANLRGGGEFGETWHKAGMLENKQNVFDDFIAAAEYLIRERYTSEDRLAISGGSNGGLLVGAVSNQRPELFGAVVCSYPLLDMVRYHEFLVASFWIPEYGSSDDPSQFSYIYNYSPYHNVIEDGRYPATLYISGDGDTRVAPLHARKMAALVQKQNSSGSQILLRYHTQAGHSGGQPVSQQIEEMVDVVSFLLWQVSGEEPGSRRWR